MLSSTTAWFDPNAAGAIGGAMGGVFGGGFGGVGGALAGTFVPKGKAKGFVVGFFLTGIVIGVLLVLTAIVALVAGQPLYVWGVFGLTGVIVSTVMGSVLPAIFKGYALAEQRKFDAEELRRS